MKKDRIGAILKNLIKEAEFTQEEFAEEIGIGLSSLKKYIKGQVSYSIETLELFADFFDCSYDYLLGKSLTPRHELQDIKQATRLTDEALERLMSYSSEYDTSAYSKRYIDTLSTLIQEGFLLEKMIDYFYIDADRSFLFENFEKFPKNFIQVGEHILNTPDIEDAYMVAINRTLAESKATIEKSLPKKTKKAGRKRKPKED